MDEQALREKNFETVKRFFQLHGLERLEVFTEDGAKELGFGMDPESPAPRWNGKKMLQENFGGNISLFAGWTWENMSFYSTQNPNRFFVEADGHGKQAVTGHETDYRNHYIFRFTMADGLIREMIEYNNPIQLMYAMGVKLPKMADPVANTRAVLNGERPLQEEPS